MYAVVHDDFPAMLKALSSSQGCNKAPKCGQQLGVAVQTLLKLNSGESRCLLQPISNSIGSLVIGRGPRVGEKKPRDQGQSNNFGK